MNEWKAEINVSDGRTRSAISTTKPSLMNLTGGSPQMPEVSAALLHQYSMFYMPYLPTGKCL